MIWYALDVELLWYFKTMNWSFLGELIFRQGLYTMILLVSMKGPSSSFNIVKRENLDLEHQYWSLSNSFDVIDVGACGLMWGAITNNHIVSTTPRCSQQGNSGLKLEVGYWGSCFSSCTCNWAVVKCFMDSTSSVEVQHWKPKHTT